MKICFIVGAYPSMKCGVGDYTNMLARELENQGNEISIITSTKAKEEKSESFKVFNIVDEWNSNSKDRIIKTLKEINPDIVHIQYPSDEFGKDLFVNILPRIIKKEINCKVIETVHEYLSYTAKGKIRNLINYLYADNIIVVENQYIEIMKTFLPMLSKRLDIKHIPISSNIPKSNISDKEKKRLKEKLSIKNEKVISYFGFVNELKGMETLIKAISNLVKDGEDIKLLILSELSKENEYHNKILDMIDSLGISDNVIVTGFIESSEIVADYLKMSDLSILPFRDGVSERNGSFLAAYVQGIPIITTSYTKEDSDGVFYVKPSDVQGIVEKSKQCLKENNVFDRNVFDWSNIAKEHMNIYK